MPEPRGETRLVAVGLRSWAGYSSRAIEGILRYGHEYGGYRFRDILWNEPTDLAAQLERLRPDGAIFTLNSPGHAEIQRQLSGSLCMVNIGADQLPGCPGVCSDDQAMLNLAADHLRGAGYRHLAWLGWSLSEGSARREAILRQQFARISCFNLQWILPGDPPDSSLDRGFEDWLNGLVLPVGVIAWSGHIAVRLREFCEKLSLRVPQDVGILSLADEQACLFSDPAISAIDASGEAIGYQAMKLLAALMQGKRVRRQLWQVKPAGVISRASTGPPAAGDDVLATARAYIEANACAGITVENVVGTISSMGRTRFYKDFLTRFGCSPAEYIRRCKLERARRLLSQSHLSVTRIAGLCGFGSVTQFGDTFKREVGSTPLVYRRKHVKEPADERP